MRFILVILLSLVGSLSYAENIELSCASKEIKQGIIKVSNCRTSAIREDGSKDVRRMVLPLDDLDMFIHYYCHQILDVKLDRSITPRLSDYYKLQARHSFPNDGRNQPVSLTSVKNDNQTLSIQNSNLSLERLEMIVPNLLTDRIMEGRRSRLVSGIVTNIEFRCKKPNQYPKEWEPKTYRVNPFNPDIFLEKNI